MNGIVRIWGSDLNKIRFKIKEIRDLVNKIHMSDILKADFNKSLDIILRLIDKGRVDAKDNRYGNGSKVYNRQEPGYQRGDSRPYDLHGRRNIPDAKTTFDISRVSKKAEEI